MRLLKPRKLGPVLLREAGGLPENKANPGEKMLKDGLREECFLNIGE